MSIGEVGLSKSHPQDELSHIIFDVNDALRRTYLQRALIVIGYALRSASAANTASSVWEIPGRNNFLFQIKAASGTPTGFTVKLQGSLTGHNVAEDWNDVTSHNNTGFHSVTSAVPYHYYRLLLSNGVSAGTIDVHFSAIGY